MKDKELRGLVLEKFYELRHKQDQVGLEEVSNIFPDDVTQVSNICEQLAESGLIHWNPLKSLAGPVGGVGRISARGVDVVDGDVAPPLTITFHDQRVTVSQSTGVIIGSSNTQALHIDKHRIEQAIEASNASKAEKEEAKFLLAKIFENSALWGVLNSLLGEG